MKYLLVLLATFTLLSCKKDTQDRNPIIYFYPLSDFTYTNKDTVYLKINSISTRPIQKITVRLIVDQLGKDSVLSTYSLNSLEALTVIDTLLLNVDWENNLLMQLKVTTVDGEQTNNEYRNVLFLQD